MDKDKVFFESIIENALDAVILIDSKGLILYWNKAAHRIFGFSKDEVIGKDLHLLLAPGKYYDKFKKGFRYFAETGMGPIVGKSIELHAVRRNNSIFPIELSVSAVKLDGIWKAIGVARDITTRKKEEGALRLSEHRHKRLVSALTSYTYTVFVEERRVVKTIHSPGCRVITGYSPEDYENDPSLWYRMIHEHDRHILLQHLSSILDGNTSSIEHRLVHKDGRIRWVRNTPAVHYDDKGQLTSYDGLIIDITQDKEAEEALRKYGEELEVCVRQRTEELFDAKNYLESVLASMLDALFVVNDDSIIQTVNDAACRLTGYEKEELIDMSLGTVIKTIDLINDNQCLDNGGINNEKEINNKECLLKAKDMNEIPVTVSGSPMTCNSEEKPCRVFVVRDISDRKLAEKKLYTSYQFQNVINKLLQLTLSDKTLIEQLQEALNIIISVPFMETIPKGVIFLIDDKTNNLVLRVFEGLSKEVIKKCLNIAPGTCMCGRAAATNEIQHACFIDERHEITYEDMVPHGHYCVPIMSMDKVLGVIGLYIKENHKCDEKEIEFLQAVSNTLATIIERKASEADKKRIQTKMIATYKMATLGEIATGIAHEINQPLTYISSILQGLKIDIKHNTINLDELRIEVDTSYEQVKRIKDIIQHLRTFGRQDDMVMENTHITTALDNTLLLMGERIHLRNIKLTKNIEPDIPRIKGSQTQIEQVFINIFQNALDAFPEKKKDAAIKVNISTLENKRLIIIKISDNGCGIENSLVDKIFEPFFTTKDVGKGTGMGLAIVYGIVTQHGGTISCDSILGEGTTFTITFIV